VRDLAVLLLHLRVTVAAWHQYRRPTAPALGRMRAWLGAGRAGCNIAEDNGCQKLRILAGSCTLKSTDETMVP